MTSTSPRALNPLDDVGGLTVDLVHPGDRGMNTIALNLADRLESLLDG